MRGHSDLIYALDVPGNFHVAARVIFLNHGQGAAGLLKAHSVKFGNGRNVGKRRVL
jgi:hypothetical protein